MRKGVKSSSELILKYDIDILRDLLQSVINEKVQESLRLQVRNSLG